MIDSNSMLSESCGGEMQTAQDMPEGQYRGDENRIA